MQTGYQQVSGMKFVNSFDMISNQCEKLRSNSSMYECKCDLQFILHSMW